jgi:hypothetical protein
MNNLFENRTEIPGFDSYESLTDNPTRINISTLGKIAQLVLIKPRIAEFEVTVEEKKSPFFEEISETKNSYYIIGDAESIGKLVSEDDSERITLVENDKNIRNIKREDILFLFEREDTVNKLNHAILDLGLDVKHYNFMWTTVGKGIVENKLLYTEYTRTVDEDSIRFDEVIISDTSFDEDYNNVLMRYTCDDQEFDFAYKRSINVIAAQTGNLKSTLTNNIVAAFANTTNDLGLTLLDDERNDGQVVVFDTETNEHHLSQKWKFYTNKNDKVSYITLKNISTNQRLTYVRSVINALVKKGKTIRTIIIDSLIDFITDFNNIEESYKLIDSILNIINQYDIPVFVTFQENPAKYNGSFNKLSGHLGSKLAQKAESHYKTSAKGDMAEIACVKNRNETQFTIQYDLNTSGDFLMLDNSGLKDATKSSGDKKLDKLNRSLDIAFVGKKSLTNDELTTWIMQTLGIKARAASDWKQKLVDSELIENANSSGKANQWVKK